MGFLMNKERNSAGCVLWSGDQIFWLSEGPKNRVFGESEKKILAQAILITIEGYILECTNNIAIQELEFFLSQFLRNLRNKLRAVLSGELGGSQVKM